jgi:hypothetical protein
VRNSVQTCKYTEALCCSYLRYENGQVLAENQVDMDAMIYIIQSFHKPITQKQNTDNHYRKKQITKREIACDC